MSSTNEIFAIAAQSQTMLPLIQGILISINKQLEAWQSDGYALPIINLNMPIEKIHVNAIDFSQHPYDLLFKWRDNLYFQTTEKIIMNETKETNIILNSLLDKNIKDKKQIEILKGINCCEAQGDYLYPLMPAVEIIKLYVNNS